MKYSDCASTIPFYNFLRDDNALSFAGPFEETTPEPIQPTSGSKCTTCPSLHSLYFLFICLLKCISLFLHLIYNIYSRSFPKVQINLQTIQNYKKAYRTVNTIQTYTIACSNFQSLNQIKHLYKKDPNIIEFCCVVVIL